MRQGEMVNIIDTLKGRLFGERFRLLTTKSDAPTTMLESLFGGAPYPHFDSNVLHAPGACVFCDLYPDAQAAREYEGINFTGYGPDPATDKRDLEVIERWGGDIPTTQGDLEEEDAAYEKFIREIDEEGLWPSRR